jgi:hypothetical protein
LRGRNDFNAIFIAYRDYLYSTTRTRFWRYSFGVVYGSLCIMHWIGVDMTKQELLKLLKLLSAIESAMSINRATLPDYLFGQIDAAVVVLEREILNDAR